MQNPEVERQLRRSAAEASRRLRVLATRHITSRDRALLDPILHAVQISAPLRERFFVASQAARHCGVSAAVFQPFALSGELMMIAAFVSDDIIDAGTLRHGSPTVAAAYGVAHATLAGEAILVLADRVRNEAVPRGAADRARAASRLFADAGLALYRGQVRSLSLRAEEATVRQVEEMARLRAGALFGACAAAPAVLAGDDAAAAALFRYGEQIGIASQHRDDILDFFGNEETMGKAVLQDIANRQPNLLWTYLRNSPSDQTFQARVAAAAGNRRLSRSQRRSIVLMARASNAAGRAIERMVQCTERAIAALDRLEPSAGLRTLRAFAGLIGDRGID